MQKVFVYLLYRFGAALPVGAALVAAVAVVALLLNSTTCFDAGYYRYVDSHPSRWADVVADDVFGDRFTEVKYLKQGWSPADSLWYYNTTQGSDLMPYDFFLVLERAGSEELFRAPEHLNGYRYLPQKASRTNPDALPVGIVADTYLGKKYVGFTCAACHTTQVNYRGTGIRIDGGPGAADMERFMVDLAAAMVATRDDPAKRKRFVAAVRAKGHYRTDEAVTADLGLWALKVDAYRYFNESRDKQGNPVRYGYARLDAFGRIYNRVLEHVLNRESLRQILITLAPVDEVDVWMKDLEEVFAGQKQSLGYRYRAHAFEALLQVLRRRGRDDLWAALRAKIFNPPNAPVSYPFLWDIPHHDYVQWNGIVPNAGLGPVGRNAGEVMGVFATLDWAETERVNLWREALAVLHISPKNATFRSSVNVHNLKSIETRLRSLSSPLWTDAVEQAGLPKLDAERVKRGDQLFEQHCESCHPNVERDSPTRRVVAQMERVETLGTDPTMANNSVAYAGFSGMLRNQYAATPVGDLLLDTRAPVAGLLSKAAENVVARPDPDKWFFTRGTDWAVDLVRDYTTNFIRASMKAGNYAPDTTAAPMASLRAYKGRSLNGIWATAPYLHNGSVPTLYDLLLPADPREGDTKDMQYRPKRFRVGSRELDTVKVGFKHGETEYEGFLFDTTLPTNSNAGHEYGTRKLNHEDRLDLVEYLKSL